MEFFQIVTHSEKKNGFKELFLTVVFRFMLIKGDEWK